MLKRSFLWINVYGFDFKLLNIKMKHIRNETQFTEKKITWKLHLFASDTSEGSSRKKNIELFYEKSRFINFSFHFQSQWITHFPFHFHILEIKMKSYVKTYSKKNFDFISRYNNDSKIFDISWKISTVNNLVQFSIFSCATKTSIK